MDFRVKQFIETVNASTYPKSIKTELIAAISCFEHDVDYEFDDDEAKAIYDIAMSLWI